MPAIYETYIYPCCWTSGYLFVVVGNARSWPSLFGVFFCLFEFFAIFAILFFSRAAQNCEKSIHTKWFDSAVPRLAS